MTTIRVTMSQHEEMSVVTKSSTAPMVEVTTSIAPSKEIEDTFEEITTKAAPVNVLDEATTKKVTAARPKGISVMDILVPTTTPKQDDRIELEEALFETTQKPVEVVATTEMDFMYPMIVEAETTKQPEQKMTISIIDKVVELLTTTPSPKIEEVVFEGDEEIPETTVKPSPESDLEKKLFITTRKTEILAETTVPTIA